MTAFPSIALAVMMGSASAYSATFYVATNGNNGGAGSLSSPWQTIRHGVKTMSGGDILIIRGGVYPDDGFLIQEFKSGTIGAPTIIKSYPEENVTYSPRVVGEYSAHGLLLSAKSNIVLSGWSVDARGCSSDGIKLDQGTIDVTLTNMVIYGCPTGMGILTTGDSEGAYMNSTITHCVLITNGWNATINEPPLHQIYLQTSGMTVENCYIEGVTNIGGGTVGIHYFGSGAVNAVFRNNCFTNCTTGILAAASYGSNCAIYNNFITRGQSWGVSVYKMHGVYVLNNTCYSNNAQINIEQATNVWVDNNIAVGGFANNPGGILIRNSDTVYVRNNLAYGSLVGGVRVLDYRENQTVNTILNSNLFAVTPTSTNEIYSARFVDVNVGDLRVLSTSDAIAHGRPQSIFSTDAVGVFRTNLAWTIGAWEYRPLSPKNLHLVPSP